jgi:hypothetical protein
MVNRDRETRKSIVSRFIFDKIAVDQFSYAQQIQCLSLHCLARYCTTLLPHIPLQPGHAQHGTPHQDALHPPPLSTTLADSTAKLLQRNHRKVIMQRLDR